MLSDLVVAASLVVSLGWSASACSEVYYEHCRYIYCMSNLVLAASLVVSLGWSASACSKVYNENCRYTVCLTWC